jgi:hypothetical protein
VRSMKSRFFSALVCLSGLLMAQEFRASLSGHITDPSGSSVSGAKIEIRSTGTGALVNVISDEDGSYLVPFINPGEYVVTVEKFGFRRVVRAGITLKVSERAVVDVPLSLGEVSQSVNVTADTALVQTESADRGLSIENNRVEKTPLQGRNVFAQAWSAPGVAVTAAVQRLRPFDIAGSSGMAISGGQPSGNEVLIDGVSNVMAGGSVAYVPPVEGTAEFKVQTTSYDAQYGWTTGGVVNIVTKAGTNEFHGSAYEFLQNTHLNANLFNNNLNGIPRQSSHINTFGGDLGGPVRKDRLFFEFAYEHIRQVIPDPFTTSVPTTQQRSGDFSQTFYAANALQVIYDPFTTVTGPTGSLVRTPFGGNVIPSTRFNPVAAKVLSLIPLGNVPGNPVTALNNLVSSGSTRKFTDFFPEYTGRVDYIRSEKTQMFVRYSRNALAEERSFHYSTTSAFNIAETSGNTPFKRENHSATVQVTHVFGPGLVLNLRAGLARFLGQSGSSIGKDFNLASLGFSPQFIAQSVPWFPRFNWAGYEGAGANPSQFDPISQSNSFQASVALVKGRHSIKTGAGLGLVRKYRTNPGYWAGNFSFDQGFTGQNPIAIQPSSGNSIASFLLGTPASGFIDVNTAPALQQRAWSMYLQDDIRVTAKLKVNVGLRWDYLSPLTDRFNALSRGFDTTSPSPLKAPGLDLKGGLLFAGVGGSRGIFKSDWNNFGPRAGFAYQLGSKTVLRGGYGLIFAGSYDDPGPAPGFSQSTAMVTSIQTGVPENVLTNPFPTGILRPVGSSLGLATYLGQGFNFPNYDRVVPWTHQFSFEIQRELPAQFLVSASYVGSRTRSLEVNKGINEIPLSNYSLGATALTQNVANPMSGLIAGTSLNGATVQRQQLLRPFPQFLGINQLYLSKGQSRYDSFQMMIYKRLSAGLNFSAAYTNSKTLEQMSYANAQDTQLLKQIAAWDSPQSLQLNGVYDLPFGKAKAIGGSVHPALSRFISGWEISGIARIQEGLPMAFPANAVPTGVSPRLSGRTLDRWFNTCTLLANGSTRGCLAGEQPVWTILQPFTVRTWPARLASVRVPGIRNLDASVIKNNYFGDRYNLIFRADFLNATNSVQFFNGPVTDVNNPSFGRIAGAQTQTNLPRFIQLSLRFQF